MSVAFKSVLRPGSPIFLLGEAPGEHEERMGTPFVGPSGQELDLQLADAGIERSACSLSNVFHARPPENDLQRWAIARKDAKRVRGPVDGGASSAGGIVDGLPWAPIPANKGVVAPAITQPALARLAAELEQVAPTVIVALGNTALAALTGLSGISKLRGTIHTTTTPGLPQGIKVLPTYHPAGVMRNYDWRPAVIVDLMKALRESKFKETRFRARSLYVEPTTEDLGEWQDILTQSRELAVDIETKAKQITCIGFAPSATEAYVVPFWTDGKSYWRSAEEEIFAYKVVRNVLASPAIKIFQNGMYDVSYCARYGWPVANFLHDTMILHHSLYPHVPKGLEFLGSLYTSERAWKRFRVRGGDTIELKRDE